MAKRFVLDSCGRASRASVSSHAFSPLAQLSSSSSGPNSDKARRANLDSRLDPLQAALHSLQAAKSQRSPLQSAIHRIIIQEAVRSVCRHSPLQASSAGPQEEPSAGQLYYDIAVTAIEDANSLQVSLGSQEVAEMSKLATLHPNIVPSLLLQASQQSVFPAELYDALAKYNSSSQTPDHLVFIVNEMLDRNVQPSQSIIRETINACCEWGYPRLALELAEKFDSSSHTGQLIEVSCWVDILSSSAENHFLEGVQTVWERVSRLKGYRPDEGLLLRILEVATRYGMSDLATSLHSLLNNVGAAREEHHFSALLESFVNAGKVPDALRLISSMKESGVSPSMNIVEPVVSVLTGPDIIDQAYYTLEDMHKAGEKVDIVALNALILASVRIRDLRRVRATQSSASDLGLVPNSDTFNLALEGCIVAKHRPLGDTILAEMTASGVKPDQTTYDRIIQLCLLPDNYEDAFLFLEEMKEKGLKPMASTYVAIMSKCADRSDRRWKLVEEEMLNLGYNIDNQIKRTVGKSLSPAKRYSRGQEGNEGDAGML